MEFKPERFLNKDGKLDPNVMDPNVAAFGFGRRNRGLGFRSRAVTSIHRPISYGTCRLYILVTPL